jgi:hypothetical protein
MSATRAMKSRMRDYRQLNTIPASFSLLFILMSLYQFGAVEPITLNWFNFTIPATWTLPVSIGVIFFALMTSETRDFMRYSTVEQALIALMLLMVLGWSLLPPDLWATHVPLLGQAVHDILVGIGSPWAGMISMTASLVGWGVLVN